MKLEMDFEDSVDEDSDLEIVSPPNKPACAPIDLTGANDDQKSIKNRINC